MFVWVITKMVIHWRVLPGKLILSCSQRKMVHRPIWALDIASATDKMTTLHSFEEQTMHISCWCKWKSLIFPRGKAKQAHKVGKVVYIYASLLQLTVESHGIYQAEKTILLVQGAIQCLCRQNLVLFWPPTYLDVDNLNPKRRQKWALLASPTNLLLSWHWMAPNPVKKKLWSLFM